MSKGYKILLKAALLALPGAALAAPAPRPPAFAMCVACHRVERGAPNGLGPNLWGVGGRKAGGVAGFAYSPAMKRYAQPWTRDRLIAFIMAPRTAVPGNRMAFAGQRDPKQAAALADYLLSLR